MNKEVKKVFESIFQLFAVRHGRDNAITSRFSQYQDTIKTLAKIDPWYNKAIFEDVCMFELHHEDFIHNLSDDIRDTIRTNALTVKELYTAEGTKNDAVLITEKIKELKELQSEYYDVVDAYYELTQFSCDMFCQNAEILETFTDFIAEKVRITNLHANKKTLKPSKVQESDETASLLAELASL